ncbi:MAG: hypothetical protein SGJ27_21760 [Candidatus Melainabacteria bacterium]|nr:hypothetical protein [Candidatus Melainabacteria bacterium]
MHEFLKKVTKNIEKPAQEMIDVAVNHEEPVELTIPENQAASDLLAECRKFYRTPMLDSERPACKLSLSKELHDLYERSNDAPLRILKEQDNLLERGQIYWGYLVEANRLLLDRANEHTLPAAIIYSTDAFFDSQINLLESIGATVSGMGEQISSDPEIRNFQREISENFEQILRRELPLSMCHGRSVYYATCLVQPQHLPHGHLTNAWFPIIADFQQTEAVMILPSHLWPEKLAAHWR